MPRQDGKKKDAVASELESFKPKSKKESGPQKINLGDGASLKRALDDAAAAVSFMSSQNIYWMADQLQSLTLAICSSRK